VLAASRLSSKAIRELSGSVPLVLMNREITGIGSVITDHGEGTRQIVEHLASLGHRTIAFLSGPLNSWSGARRWSALDTAARRLRLKATRLGPFIPSIDGGAAAADAAIASGATGIVAFNDLLALGVLRRLSERGVNVPAQLSLVGYDDIFGADLSSPALTTLAGPIEEAGRTALAQLVRLIDQPSRKPQRTVLPSHLVIRDSTAPIA
jgi:LacI family transcriptional regulator